MSTIPKRPELLAEAGYENGFKMGFACPAGAYVTLKRCARLYRLTWRKSGIEADLEIMESGQYWDQEAAKELPPTLW
jgi:peptide/nickel transport system substrate-binding protein